MNPRAIPMNATPHICQRFFFDVCNRPIAVNNPRAKKPALYLADMVNPVIIAGTHT